MSPDSRWSVSQPFPAGAGDCREPAVATVGSVLHAAWTQDKKIYHAYLDGENWSEPKPVGIGRQPALASTPAGELRCAFSAELLGNVEIYVSAWDGANWGLPEVVSRTTGSSTCPALVSGPDGSLHIVWADTTPGYSTVYYGGRAPGAGWTSTPIPNGRGNYPTIGTGRGGEVYAAWQSRLVDTARFEVFGAICSAGRWSLPENISDTAFRHSIYPKGAGRSTGGCHLVWQEDLGGRFGVRYAGRAATGWPPPVDVSGDAADCRLPRVTSNRQGYIQVVWVEGPLLKHRVRPPGDGAAWGAVETASESCAELNDLSAATGSDGRLHILWCGYTQASVRRLHYLRREPLLKYSTFIPAIARSEQ